jgi:hypothetical protein
MRAGIRCLAISREDRILKRRTLLPLVVVVVLAAASMLVVYVRGGYRNLGATISTVAPTTTTIASDFTEVAANADLAQVANAKFASITLATEGGKAYMVAASQQPFKDLAAAVAAAKPASGTVAAGGSNLIFVFSDRRTMTFDLDLSSGLLGRGGKVYQPQGNLSQLVGAVTKAAQ